jgi:hypothetical protein
VSNLRRIYQIDTFYWSEWSGVLCLKKRILNFRIAATHPSIVDLPRVNDPRAISDFDAFAFDPSGMLESNGLTVDSFLRRRQELRDLIHLKGGIVVCLLRPEVRTGVPIPGFGNVGTYELLNFAMDSGALAQIQSALRAGQGSRIAMIPGATGVSVGYLRILASTLQFAAYLDTNGTSLAARAGTVLAVDSVSHPIAVEFTIGAGRVCFLPIPEGAPGDRVGSAVVRVVEAHYGGPSEIEEPAWVPSVTVPGANANDARIVQLEETKRHVKAEIAELTRTRTETLNYRILLYGYGKSALEPIVRAALRLVGFKVPEPDLYSGEWDVEIQHPTTGSTALAEVEGSQGAVDVDKYRQLLDYVQAEVLEGRDHKGILIGNGFRLAPPEATERQNQFSNHALLGAQKNQFCLLPTSELFKAVCAVLERPGDEGQKIQIRDSILATVGVWKFAREAPSTSSEMATNLQIEPRGENQLEGQEHSDVAD